MKKVRQNVFETNSSSTHSVCIAKNVELIFPEKVYFEFGEFGWERDRLDSIHEKASYLYTGLFAQDRLLDFNKIILLLSERGIGVEIEEPVYKINIEGTKYLVNDGYVDHSEELGDFLDAVCNDEEQLFSFLFSPLSFILTGNDNSDYDVNIYVDYPCYEYYKGN